MNTCPAPGPIYTNYASRLAHLVLLPVLFIPVLHQSLFTIPCPESTPLDPSFCTKRSIHPCPAPSPCAALKPIRPFPASSPIHPVHLHQEAFSSLSSINPNSSVLHLFLFVPVLYQAIYIPMLHQPFQP
jgi:hypothetical protein